MSIAEAPRRPNLPFEMLEGESPTDYLSRTYHTIIAPIKERMERIVPIDRKFEIIERAIERGVTIVFRREDGGEVDLSSYLPEGFIFLPSDDFRCDLRKGKVHYDPEKLQRRTGLLQLFHEIGHSCQGSNYQIPRSEQVAENMFPIFRYLTALVRGRLKGQGIGGFFTEEYVNKLYNLQARSERDASAYALHRLRELEKRGFNVFAGFENLLQIKAYISLGLFTHEHAVRAIEQHYDPGNIFTRTAFAADTWARISSPEASLPLSNLKSYFREFVERERAV